MRDGHGPERAETPAQGGGLHPRRPGGAQEVADPSPPPQHRARDRQARPVPHRATALLDPQPRCRTRGLPGLPALRSGHPGVEPAVDGTAHRPLPQTRRRNGLSLPPALGPSAHDRRRKLDAVEALVPIAEQAGLPLAHLAPAFVAAHPAVTSATIGPRTMEQLDDLVAGAGTFLDDDLLDRIDEIVPPGTDLGPIDVEYVPPRRRRPHHRMTNHSGPGPASQPPRRSLTSQESAPPTPPITTAPTTGGTSGVRGSPPGGHNEGDPASAFTREQGRPESSGAMGIRTPDLLHAMEARYQLRHSPLYAGRFPRSAMELLYRRLEVGCDLRACGWTCGGRFPRRIPWSGARIKA